MIGVYESDSLFESGALIVPLATLQRMMGREGQVTGFVIQVAVARPGRNRGPAEADRGGVPRVAATPARDHVQRDVQIRLAKMMAWATTVLALLLGSIGMLEYHDHGSVRADAGNRRPAGASAGGAAACCD